MFQIRFRALATAGALALSLAPSGAATFTEDFSSNPAAHGWTIFGNTNLFQWDPTNLNLRVTWDSTQPNSYFYLPIGTILAKDDDFTFAFDLTLSDASTNDTTGPLQFGAGFLNLADATDPGFSRGAGVSPNVAEFDCYPSGYFPGYPSPAAASPAFIDSTSSAFAPTFIQPYDIELPTNQLMRVVMTYTASNQTAVLEITTNGIPVATFPPMVLNDPGDSQFSDTNDYRCTIFSINSYSEAGQMAPYVGSILAHGTIGNISITVPDPPVRNLTGAFDNGLWQVRFGERTNWLYTLERTMDFLSWTNVSPETPGVAGTLQLTDTNSPAARAFYRVRANRP